MYTHKTFGVVRGSQLYKRGHQSHNFVPSYWRVWPRQCIVSPLTRCWLSCDEHFKVIGPQIIALLADICWLRHTFSSGPGEQTKPGSQGWVKQPSPALVCQSVQKWCSAPEWTCTHDLHILRPTHYPLRHRSTCCKAWQNAFWYQSALFHPHMHAESPRFESGCCQAVDLFH